MRMRSLLILATTVALLSAACGDQSDTAPEAAAVSDEETAAENAAQEATIVVTGSGFSPESVTIEPGRPVRLHFERTAEPNCGEEVVFASLGIRQALAAGQTTTVELPPQPAGTLDFACGMGMMMGKLLVQGPA